MQERKCFGKFIHQKRMEKGFSQQQLAEQLFVTESAISKWERGVNYPDITMISDICKALDISEHELITASNDTEYRQLKKDADTFRKLSKISFMSCVIGYAVALIVCFICNLAVNHTLSWFWIVLGSIVCAFSFFPSFSKFFSKDKFFYFLLTSMASVMILLIICGIYTSSVRWVPVACTSVLLGYVLLFFPVVIRKYMLPPILNKVKFLIYVILLFILTILVLLSTTMLVNFAVAKALLLTLYCYTPFILMGIFFAFTTDKLIKSGVGVLLIGAMGYGVNYVMALLFDLKEQYTYAINFFDWRSYINGNVMFIILVCTLSVGISLVATGIIKKINNKNVRGR